MKYNTEGEIVLSIVWSMQYGCVLVEVLDLRADARANIVH